MFGYYCYFITFCFLSIRIAECVQESYTTRHCVRACVCVQSQVTIEGRYFGPFSSTKFILGSSFKAATVVRTRLLPINNAHLHCLMPLLPKYKRTAMVFGRLTYL
ncbi:unnamed protein product [Sphacelaria rigidula]